MKTTNLSFQMTPSNANRVGARLLTQKEQELCVFIGLVAIGSKPHITKGLRHDPTIWHSSLKEMKLTCHIALLVRYVHILWRLCES
jgi:hypothetical protein